MKVDLWPVNGMPPPTKTRSGWRQFVERHLPSVVIYLMVATLVAVVLYPHMVRFPAARSVSCGNALAAVLCSTRVS